MIITGVEMVDNDVTISFKGTSSELYTLERKVGDGPCEPVFVFRLGTVRVVDVVDTDGGDFDQAMYRVSRRLPVASTER